MDIMSAFMDNMARAIDETAQEVLHIRLGFALLLFPFHDTESGRLKKEPGGIGANYISNAQKEDVIKALRETADRLENNEIIGKPIGSA